MKKNNYAMTIIASVTFVLSGIMLVILVKNIDPFHLFNMVVWKSVISLLGFSIILACIFGKITTTITGVGKKGKAIIFFFTQILLLIMSWMLLTETHSTLLILFAVSLPILFPFLTAIIDYVMQSSKDGENTGIFMPVNFKGLINEFWNVTNENSLKWEIAFLFAEIIQRITAAIAVGAIVVFMISLAINSINGHIDGLINQKEIIMQFIKITGVALIITMLATWAKTKIVNSFARNQVLLKNFYGKFWVWMLT